MPVLRVESADFSKRNSCELANLLEVKHLVHLEGVYVGRSVDSGSLQTVFLGVVHCIQGTYEGGNITPGLFWQIWPYVPELSFATASADSLVDIAGSTVVRSNGKVPVTENFI